MRMAASKIEDLIGKTLISVTPVGTEKIFFRAEDGSEYKMFHNQSCSESVSIEDITGELMDLVGVPILQASEESNNTDARSKNALNPRGSYTWTFYKLATIKGYVTLRWFGESNGYYSEAVDFYQTKAPSDLSV